MKLSEKVIVVGIVSFFILGIGALLVGNLVGMIIPGGNEFLNSYFGPLYGGVILVGSIVVSCTYFIVKKINLLLEEIKSIKNKS